MNSVVHSSPSLQVDLLWSETSVGVCRLSKPACLTLPERRVSTDAAASLIFSAAMQARVESVRRMLSHRRSFRRGGGRVITHSESSANSPRVPDRKNADRATVKLQGSGCL